MTAIEYGLLNVFKTPVGTRNDISIWGGMVIICLGETKIRTLSELLLNWLGVLILGLFNKEDVGIACKISRFRL